MQLSEDETKSLGLLGPDTGLRAFNEESLQTLVLEAPDHPGNVTYLVTLFKTPNA